MDSTLDYLDSEKREKVKNYRILNQYVKKGQVLLTGSSLMEQFPIYEFIQDFDIKETIYNRGVSGFTTSEMIPVLDTLIFDLAPGKIFINIGTNDLGAPDYTIDALAERYEYIVKQIKERLPEAVIYIMAYYPVNGEHDFGYEFAKEWLKVRTNERIDEANEAIKQMADRLNCKFININQSLYDREGNLKNNYSVEGVHMYASGYRAVLDELLKYVIE